MTVQKAAVLVKAVEMMNVVKREFSSTLAANEETRKNRFYYAQIVTVDFIFLHRATESADVISICQVGKQENRAEPPTTDEQATRRKLPGDPSPQAGKARRRGRGRGGGGGGVERGRHKNGIIVYAT